ncbi:class III lanthionine synthetase LanKC [Streptomyces sp. Z26]|uniref:class III lanthionine synthetase LanKC n=1 Tax=Streptomyces sp. Z26 TaxID=2500177 RepID=UPI000EF1716F|nr:class III lanthionine synthetase LanKC [Streptomyces sp. Z26]RLL65763.1 lantipeptide synthetase [Streptomyces sp. Z26]
MSKGYAVFCDADRHFYDAPHRVASTADAPGERYPAARREVPEGWQRHESGDWLAFRPVRAQLPDQGWKIHVSARLENAERVLDTVWDYCVPRSIAFKFVPSRYLLHNRNAKYADRAASGKFVTVYPADDAECHRVAADLDSLLRGETGPYILSDLRWADGPVHVRYGGFTERNCHDEHGTSVPAITGPDGKLVPDHRGPAFRVPEWLELPEFLRPHEAARTATTVTDLPYRIERALHFSNGGGVYEGVDERTGERVVLKEARPHAGLAADGADAVTRLARERSALERLSGVAQTPEVRDAFTLGEHHFLVLEHIGGKPLNTFFARRHPLIDPDPAPEALAAYTDWALRVHALVEEAVTAVHARGIAFNDLHLFNIMVSEDESSVVLLDFEAAADAGEMRRQSIANPGFVAPADRRGTAVDRYALACLRIALFLPLTSLLAVDRAKAADLARIAAEHFPVPPGFLETAVEEILHGGADDASGTHPGTAPGMRTRPRPAADPYDLSAARDYLPVRPGDWPLSRDSMAAAIRASATPGREDRYFPGDIAQFASPLGGASFGYGAAGVLHALAETGAGDCPEAEDWLLRRTKEPPPVSPLGFYDGLAGIAWLLHRAGHPAHALELADRCTAQDWGAMGHDLHSGLAGLGLALDALGAATGEPGPTEAALRCARLLSARYVGDPAPGTDRKAGLLYGETGPALFFVRLHERTGDPALLDWAAAALRRDLERCVTGAGGTLQVDEGWRTMPYLGAGSVGIGMVLDDYLEHRADEAFDAARRQIVRAAQAKFYAQPGLFRGAAGMVLHLARTTAGGPGTTGADLARQIDALSWSALPYQGRLAFPGEQMMRLSMDLNTGTAGCLLALGSALHDGARPALPFLPAPRRAPEPVPTGDRTGNTHP